MTGMQNTNNMLTGDIRAIVVLLISSVEASEHTKNREQILSKYYKDKKTIDSLVNRFKVENDPLDILIVCDMFLTGFDAPLEIELSMVQLILS